MITVKLHYQDKTLIGIESIGHAGFSYRGKDIVCAAVSTLMQALLLGLERYLPPEDLGITIDADVPLMSIVWQKSRHRKLAPLTETIASSIEQIAHENPKYVKVVTCEHSNGGK